MEVIMWGKDRGKDLNATLAAMTVPNYRDTLSRLEAESIDRPHERRHEADPPGEREPPHQAVTSRRMRARAAGPRPIRRHVLLRARAGRTGARRVERVLLPQALGVRPRRAARCNGGRGEREQRAAAEGD